jgi:hypothetical protein
MFRYRFRCESLKVMDLSVSYGFKATFVMLYMTFIVLLDWQAPAAVVGRPLRLNWKFVARSPLALALAIILWRSLKNLLIVACDGRPWWSNISYNLILLVRSFFF